MTWKMIIVTERMNSEEHPDIFIQYIGDIPAHVQHVHGNSKAEKSYTRTPRFLLDELRDQVITTTPHSLYRKRVLEDPSCPVRDNAQIKKLK